MERIINAKNVDLYAYVNDKVVKRPIRGIVLSFMGLNGLTNYASDPYVGEFYGNSGFLFVVPQTDPWCWMNKYSVAYTDEIVDALFEKFDLPKNAPIASTGGSMGGLSALVYTVYAKRTPVVCVTNCPVCDAVFHYNERPDLPRSMYNALYSYPGTLEEALKSISPLHLVDKMPHIEYHILHCDRDAAVSLQHHSAKLVEKMKAAGLGVTFDVIRGRGHCDLDYNGKNAFYKYVIDGLARNGAK